MDEKGFKNNRESSIAQKLLGHCAGYFNLWISERALRKEYADSLFKRFVQCAVDIAAYCSGNYTGIGYSKEYQLINQGGFPEKEILFAI